MSTWQTLFDWPNGSTIGNFVDDGVMFVVTMLIGRVVVKRIHEKLERHHAELKAHVSGLLTPSTNVVNVINPPFPASIDDPVNWRDRVLERINFTPEARKPEPIPWPAGLAPVALNPKTSPTAQLPPADVLVIAYTAAEGQALADVLTPGVESAAWVRYTNNWPAIKKLIVGHDAPSLEAECSLIYYMCKIGTKRVLVAKSNMHPSTDGPNLPIRTAWAQWISQCQPELVITTGTAGGIGATTVLGDVLVTNRVRADCTKLFEHEPWANELFVGPDFTPGPQLTAVAPLLAPNAQKLKPTATRDPIVHTTGDVISCDAFLFDDAEDTYGLRSYDPAGVMEEMDEFALCLAIEGMTNPPRWLSIRCASDPQVPKMSSIAAEKKWAEEIYERLGYYAAIGSSICCWAVIADIE